MKKLTPIKWKQLVIFLFLVKSINSYSQAGGPIFAFGIGIEESLVEEDLVYNVEYYDVGYANFYSDRLFYSLEYERYVFNKKPFQGPKIHVGMLFYFEESGDFSLFGVSTGVSLSYLQGNNQRRPLLKPEIGLSILGILDLSYSYSIGNVDNFFPSNYNRGALLVTIKFPLADH